MQTPARSRALRFRHVTTFRELGRVQQFISCYYPFLCSFTIYPLSLTFAKRPPLTTQRDGALNFPAVSRALPPRNKTLSSFTSPDAAFVPPPNTHTKYVIVLDVFFLLQISIFCLFVHAEFPGNRFAGGVASEAFSRITSPVAGLLPLYIPAV